MKNNVISSILAFLVISMSMNAATISSEVALHKALAFLSSKDRNAIVETFSISNKVYMYKVVTTDGWCLVSSETSLTPILAYSLTDDFPAVDDMPDAMKWLFSYYEDAIAYAKEHYDDTYINAWDENDRNSINSANREVVYLSRLGYNEWGQKLNNSEGYSACEKIYNKFCPDFHSVSCYRTITGCGAVALGQVLWYYQWPHWGLIPEEMLNDSGEVSDVLKYKIYDWNLMPENITSSTPIKQVDMIASYLRDCGYAESMEYGNGVSTTYVVKIAEALMNHFGYSSVQYLSRSANPVNWTNRIKNEIRAGRPVIYRGGNDTGGGHFFVLHGFDGDYFKINWGWRGDYNNVMCTLDHIYYDDTLHYNDGQWAIFNIEPNYPSCSPITIPSSAVLNTNFVIQNGGAITIGNRTITNGMQGVIISQESVTLNSGFNVEHGARVDIEIKDMHCEGRGHIAEPEKDNPYIPNTQHKLRTFEESPFVRKILHNGQLLIEHEGRTYNAQGLETR